MFKKRFGVTDIVVGESGDIYFIEDVDQNDELERIREEQRLKEEKRKLKVKQYQESLKRQREKDESLNKRKRSHPGTNLKFPTEFRNQLEDIKRRAREGRREKIFEKKQSNEESAPEKVKEEPELIISDNEEVILPISTVIIDPTDEFEQFYEVHSDSDESSDEESLAQPLLPRKPEQSVQSVFIKEEKIEKNHSPPSYNDFYANFSSSEDEKPLSKIKKENSSKTTRKKVKLCENLKEKSKKSRNESNISKKLKVESKPFQPSNLDSRNAKKLKIDAENSKSGCEISQNSQESSSDTNEHLTSPQTRVSNKFCIYCDNMFPSLQERRHHKCKYLDCPEGSYICRICGKTLTRQNFYNHVHGMPPCKFCGIEILNPKRMKLHIRKRHWKEEGLNQKYKYAKAKEGELECDYCGATFKAGVKHHKFLSHLYKHLSPDAFACTICGLNYKKMKLLRSHYKRKHSDAERLKFKCEMCDKSYKQKSGLALHQLSEHGYGECEVCKKFVKSKEEMVTHMATHGNFECERCQKTFLTPIKLKFHMDRHARMDQNGQVRKEFSCELCGRGFTQKSGMLQHQWNEHGYGECEVCGHFVKSKEEMVTHMATHGNFECERCQRSFLTPTRLKHHMDRHLRMDRNGGIDPIKENQKLRRENGIASSAKSYPCPKCDQKFTDQRSFESHMRFESQHPCEICGKIFNYSNNLKTHRRRIHEIDLKCEICKTEIPSKEHLVEHMKMHGNFDCQICGIHFIAPSELKRHMKLKHVMKDEDDGRVNCNYCAKSFSKNRIQAHVFRFHKESFEEWKKGEEENP